MGNLIEKFYRGLPIVRELFQIRDSLRHGLGTLQATQFMRDWELELERNSRFADPRRLVRYSFQVNSQSGEDGILHEIFRRIGTGERRFVEIGLEDGLESNTAFLLAKNWSGYWIDSAADFQQTLARHGVGPDRVRTAVAFVTRENVASTLASLGVPTAFDLLSIDIDQNTYYVWEALHEYRPRVVVIEYNAALPPDLDWKVGYDPQRVWDGSQNFGASLKALELLGSRLGYSLVGCDLAGTNAFFVRADLVGERFAPPYTAENHHEPVRYALLHRRGHRRSLLDAGTT
ncbi:MAG TPA: hypothetical protein VFU59_08190 [Candidatus Eisenbacteria bacterium]|nr:hypothetical protein [Candidatus Eisenbacteria bacterium]